MYVVRGKCVCIMSQTCHCKQQAIKVRTKKNLFATKMSFLCFGGDSIRLACVSRHYEHSLKIRSGLVCLIPSKLGPLTAIMFFASLQRCLFIFRVNQNQIYARCNRLEIIKCLRIIWKKEEAIKHVHCDLIKQEFALVFTTPSFHIKVAFALDQFINL